MQLRKVRLFRKESQGGNYTFPEHQSFSKMQIPCFLDIKIKYITKQYNLGSLRSHGTCLLRKMLHCLRAENSTQKGKKLKYKYLLHCSLKIMDDLHF